MEQNQIPNTYGGHVQWQRKEEKAKDKKGGNAQKPGHNKGRLIEKIEVVAISNHQRVG